MKKKILATLLCASLAATLLAGCGGSGNDASSASSDAATTDESKPAEDNTADDADAATEAEEDTTAVATTGGDYKFEIIVKSYQSSYWQAAVTGVNQKAEELGVTVNCTGPNAESDIADQVNMLNNAINNAPTGIGLAACDQEACLDSL